MKTLAYSIVYAMIFVFGVTVASFINVVIYRVPIKRSVVKGRSFCPSCGHTLRPYDMIPVLSWFVLRGKCRDCHSKISFRYPLVEFLGGAFAMISFACYGATWGALLTFAVAILLLAVTFIDVDTMIIPNRFVIALAIAAIMAAAIFPEPDLVSRAIGFFAASAPMFLLTLMRHEAFGGGDIKLIAACGFLLGWQNLLCAMFIAFLTGGVWAIYLLCSKKAKKGTHFAFGPFLSLGIIIAMYWGDVIIPTYLGLFGL